MTTLLHSMLGVIVAVGLMSCVPLAVIPEDPTVAAVLPGWG